MRKTEMARGWGIRVGGKWPSLSYRFDWNKGAVEQECEYPDERVVRAVLLPLAEYRRLKRIERAAKAAKPPSVPSKPLKAEEDKRP